MELRLHSNALETNLNTFATAVYSNILATKQPSIMMATFALVSVAHVFFIAC